VHQTAAFGSYTTVHYNALCRAHTHTNTHTLKILVFETLLCKGNGLKRIFVLKFSLTAILNSLLTRSAESCARTGVKRASICCAYCRVVLSMGAAAAAISIAAAVAVNVFSIQVIWTMWSRRSCLMVSDLLHLCSSIPMSGYIVWRANCCACPTLYLSTAHTSVTSRCERDPQLWRWCRVRSA
jgi:hypothetical protein